ncbi:MAG TPA: folylpolyglutamate synthase/dihydrofolate synthase family protein [Negativicutes bacterium]|jgi:dihydrofolate synthase/folylpolyglutamate synthase
MNYEQSLEYLSTLNTFGINFGLKRIERLLTLMHNPERRFKTVHVTGTNGKGSTTAMLTAILSDCGIKTGMYTSPHLAEYTERMIVDGIEITPSAFAEAVHYTSRFVDQMVGEGWEHPTEFEVLTAAALYYFAAAGVEYAVIEVGMGGLLDSTNVIMPEVAVITNVTLEHTDRCGTTLTEIGRHKAGIIKQGVPVITAAKGEALDVIRQTAVAKEAQLYVLGRDFYGHFAGLDGYRQKLVVETKGQGNIGTFVLGLLGRHQIENSSIAVMTALVLAQREQRITVQNIASGLAKANWPGRFEVVAGQPLIIIDGAHNPDGARVLRENLDELFPGKDIVFLLGILKDKDVTGIIKNLIRPDNKVVVVAPISERAGEPAEIAREIQAKQVEIADSIASGIEQVKTLAGTDGVVCVAGSLYLIGTARQIICK